MEPTNKDLINDLSYIAKFPENCNAPYICRLAAERLAYYEDLEEQGRLVALPCKVGDTVWVIPTYNGKPYCGAVKDEIQMIGVTSRGFHLKLRAHHDYNKTYMLGKTVFLTREEAEAALKEMDG